MTADGGEDHDDAPSLQAVEEDVYTPKTPLWRRAAERKRSKLEVVLTVAVGVAAIVSLLGTLLLLEADFFAGPATTMSVTITAIESVSQADRYSTGAITYRVSLPDGTQARFTSLLTHKPVTRLSALVSRGRITGRTIVSSPYVVLPDE